MTGAVERRWIAPLDGIRALAFLAVYLVHVYVPHMPGGGLGVAVFFTLSGFLITGILLDERQEEGRVRLGRFYLRRTLRLAPALLLVVAFSVACALVAFEDSPDLRHETLAGAPAVVLYVGNWVRAFADHGGVLGLLAHTWSLSIEEQFYLAWPVLLLAAFRWKGARGVLAVATVGALASLAVRLILWDGAHSLARIYNGTDTNADQLLAGCALAAAIRLYPSTVARVCRLAVLPAIGVLLVFVFAPIPDGPLHTWGYTALALTSALFIGHAASATRGGVVTALSWGPLAYAGRLSYGLYLWHFPLALILGDRFPLTPVRVVVVLACTFVAAAASFYLVERPILRWRNRARALGSEREVSLTDQARAAA